jgi:hypothetical protein
MAAQVVAVMEPEALHLIMAQLTQAAVAVLMEVQLL